MEEGGTRLSSRFNEISNSSRSIKLESQGRRQGPPEVAPPSATQAQISHHGQQHIQKHQHQQASTNSSVSAKKEDEGYVGSNDKQNTRQPSSRGPGITRDIAGPRAKLYPLAFTVFGTSRGDTSGRHGEDRGSPQSQPHQRHGQRGGNSPNSSSGTPRAGSEGRARRHCCPALALTRDMCSTYSARNPLFRFTPDVPRRVLTVPSAPAGNNGLDNSEFNLIARVNDVLEAPETCYSVLDLLGQGTFGQVFRCQDHSSKDIVAIKVVKNKPAYRNQAMLEIQVAKQLNDTYDPHDKRNIVRLLDCFQFQNHLCLVFELLSINLFELLKQNQFRGLPLNLIRHFIKQILEALGALEQANVIHCDLKPENILLMGKAPDGEEVGRGAGGGGGGSGAGGREGGGGAPGANRLKVIDFGSACYEGQTMYSYIQSRFYRSPEVLLGLPYDGAIDIWSLGCISVEMFLGLPVFPGVSDHNQICRIVEMTGSLPEFMLENGKDTLKFFKKVPATEGGDADGMRRWRSGADMAVSPDREDGGDGDRTSRRDRGGGRGYRHVLKTPEEYARDTNTTVPQLKKYFKHSNIPDIIQSYPLPGAHRRGAASASGSGSGSSHDSIAQEKEARRVFTHFVLGLLNPNPWKRWTPKQAASHPFITGQPHPRDLGALTIVDDPLVSNRYTRQMHALQVKQQKSQEQERKQAHRLRQQQREQGRALAVLGTSQPRNMPSSLSGSAQGSILPSGAGGTPGSMGSLHSQYHASPLQRHMRHSSGDSGLMAMQIAHPPQGQGTPRGGGGGSGSSRGGGGGSSAGEDHRFGMSRPIDVPAGGAGSGGGGGGGGSGGGNGGIAHGQHSLVSGQGRGGVGRPMSGAGAGGRISVGGGAGGGHDLIARSMGYPPVRGGVGTSYPPQADDDDDLDSGRTADYSYSYSAASFSLGGASGNYVASDFGYALQRPGLRYEPTSYRQSPPSGGHSSSHVGASSMRIGGLHGGGGMGRGPGMGQGSSFTTYGQQAHDGGRRGHERGGRAMSMDQTQTAPLHYYVGAGSGGIGAQLPGVPGQFGPQSLRYSSNAPPPSSSSVSATTAGPPGYTPLARGGFWGPPAGAFRSDAPPQGSVPWVRAGRGIGSSQPISGGTRAHSTSPLCGSHTRPPVMDFPSVDAASEFAHDPSGDDMSVNTHDGGTTCDNNSNSNSNHHYHHHSNNNNNNNHSWVGSGGGGRVAGIETDVGMSHRPRTHTTTGRRGHRRDIMGSLGTDPDVASVEGGGGGSVAGGGAGGAAFSLQLDDVGRLQGGDVAAITSPLDWLTGDGVDDPEGVHKRSLNGTSKGVSPRSKGMTSGTGGTSSPHDGEGDLIRRVACDEPLPGMFQQQPPQLNSLLSQQLQQYRQQAQGQGQSQQRSRTPFGSSPLRASGGGDMLPGSSDLSPGGTPQHPQHQQRTVQDSSGYGGGRGGAGGVYGRGNSQQQHQGGGGVDEGASEQSGGGVGSAWATPSSTRTLRRRASAGSSEFYFVDTLQQQQQQQQQQLAGAGGSGSYVPPPRSPASAGGAGRSPYSGRGHGLTGAGGAQSSFSGGGIQQQQQQAQQGQQGQGHWPIPPRPPRSSDISSSGMGGGGDSVTWVGSGGGGGEGSWAGLVSPMHQQQRGGGGGRGPGGWDEREGSGVPDVMHSIHEGNPSPDS